MNETTANDDPEGENATDPVVDALTNLRFLLSDTDLAAEIALEENPSPEQRRRLEDARDEIARKIAVVDGRITAMIHQSGSLQPPSMEQVREIATLSAEAERLTNQANAASGAVELTAKVLELASELAG